MASKKSTGKLNAASAMSAKLSSNSGDSTAVTRDIPPVGESAPGDALYETLEDFVLDQSEGEESSDDAEGFEESGGGALKQNKVSEGDGEDKNAAGVSSAGNRNDGDDIDNQTSQILPEKQRRRTRVTYTADEELVLYLLHTHVSLHHDTRVEVFNRVFHGQGVKRFAKLSTAELAEHEAWKEKIDKAMEDAGIASLDKGKQENETDSADDQASQPAPPGQRRDTRARYTTEHEIVMHILRGRKNIDSTTLAEIFNHIFRAEGVVRNKGAIGKHWGRFKTVIQKRFSTLSPEEQAVYDAWRQEVDDAIEELSG